MKQKWYDLYLEIKDEVKSLQFDTKYKSERKLSEQFNVHRVTVKKAIDQLIKDGYLYRIEKRGTFISKKNFYNSNVINNPLEQLNSRVSDFRFIKHSKFEECLNFTKRYYNEEKLTGIEEIFVSKQILPSNWKVEYENEIGWSLFKFLEDYNLTSVNYSQKEVTTFLNNSKHYIMIKTDIFDYKNDLIAITTIIHPFRDFSLKFIDYSNQSKTLSILDDK